MGGARGVREQIGAHGLAAKGYERDFIRHVAPRLPDPVSKHRGTHWGPRSAQDPTIGSVFVSLVKLRLRLRVCGGAMRGNQALAAAPSS